MKFADALLALEPHPDVASDPFGPLVGSWDLTVTWYDELGKVERVVPGEWHFARILEGRAVQDVWIVPRRSARGGGNSGEYGTSIRYAQPGGTWRSLWIGPYHDYQRSFTAHAANGEIVLDTDAGTEPAMRWVFSNITRDRFDWHNYEIGNPDRLIQTFEAVRQSGPTS